jgi:hypothetical protein
MQLSFNSAKFVWPGLSQPKDRIAIIITGKLGLIGLSCNV